MTSGPCLDGLSLALSQISFAVNELTKKNFDRNVSELRKLVQSYGPEAERHLFRSLLSYVDFSSDKGSNKDSPQVTLLLQECQELVTKPNFVSVLCYAIDNPESQQRSIKHTQQLLPQLSKTLKLSKLQEVVFGIALQYSSNTNLRVYALNFVKQKVPDLLRAYIDSDLGSGEEGAGFRDIAIEVLHLLLSYILKTTKEDKVLRKEQLKAFLDLLRKDFPRDCVPVVLEPLLYADYKEEHSKLNLDTGTLTYIMADVELCNIMEEIGYNCCASIEECKETLERYGTANINSLCVAKVLGMMARTVTGLEGGGTFQSTTVVGPRRDDQPPLIQSWNVKIFVDILKELVPSLNWHQVIFDLDHPEFIVKTPEGIRIIVFAYLKATDEIFPIEAIYRRWVNTLGQLSWFEQSLSDPDVFCYADFPYHPVDLENLKSSPDDSQREIATWKSLELVEALLYLSESGHYEAVLKLFSSPIKDCPDVLVLALLQVNSTWHTLRNDLVSMLMPLFLGNHPNSMSVLHYAWHGQGQSPSVRQLVMQSMADWYMKADAKGDQVEQQTRLSRILDVAQDLKALSMLLSSTPFAFVIDLAALASRREYLKLDKWLNDKKQEHQDSFIIALVNFLKKRCPHLVGIQADKDMPRAVQLPQETISTMLSFLQSNLSAEVGDTVKTMLSSHGPILKNRQTVGLPNPSLGMPMKRNSGYDGGPNTPPMGNQGDPFISFSSSFGSSAPGSQLGGFGSHPLSNNSAPGSSSFGSLGASNSFGSSTVDSLQSMAISSIGNQNFGGSSFGGQSHTGSFGGPSLTNTSVNTSSLGNQSLGQSLGQLGQSLGGQPLGHSLSSSSLPTMGSQSLIGPGNNLGHSLSGVHGLSSLGPSIGNSSAIGGSLGQSMAGGASIGGPSLGVGGPIGAPPGGKRNPLLPTSGIGTNIGAFSSYQQQQHQQNTAIQSRQHADRLKQAATGDLSAVFPGMDQTFTKETEDEVNSYFQRLFNQPPNSIMTIEEVLEMLKRFKDSPIRKERDIFQCMLRNLFEEYKFFPQYPEKELHIIACLFGGIIEQGLVTYMALGIALRYVLEALRKPLGSKMYMFGTTALERFKTRLKDYPHYCQHLGSIPHFKDFPHQLVDYINYGQKSLEPPMQTRAAQNNSPNLFGRSGSSPGRLLGFSGTAASSAQSPTPIVTSGTSTKSSTVVTSTLTTVVSASTSSLTSTSQRKEPSIANTTNIDTLLGATEPAEIQMPPDSVQDKIHFIFNNISGQTLQNKADELKQLDIVDYYPWLAQYFVMKRVSIEPNFHQLYTDFLKALTLVELSKAVLTETFRNIKVLLRSDKGPANFSDRSLLKNLGHWLGMQTLANNKPILFKDLELKSLLIEAFFKGQQELLYVVPFVAKVLESCAKSKVFKPPNPWLMGVMSALAELHQLSDLKLNLKFEIEVLCNTLGLDLKEIKPSDFVKDPEILEKLEHQLTANEKEKAAISGSALQQQGGPPTPMFAYHQISIASLNGLAPHLQINQNIPVFQRHAHLKQCIRPAVERAVQELLHLVVEKAMKICLTTAETIVKKDFALDPEESRMRIAAHHMVRNITAGISMITCKDLILSVLNTHIKSNLLATLRGADQQQKEQLEQVAAIVAADNLDLACAFIQKTAIERALHEIDKRLASEYELRRHARSENRRYCDPQVLTYQAERMPEQIRLKVGGVTSSQMTVYEEFARSIPGFLPPEAAGGVVEPFPKPLTEPMSNILPGSESHSYMPDEVVHILGRCAAEIEQHIHHMDQQLRLHPAASPYVSHLHNILEMVVNARVTRDNVSSVKLIRKSVEGVLTAMVPNEHEMFLRYKDCHLIILRGFQDQRGYGPIWTSRQVLRALADLPADIRYNLEGIDILIRAHLINVREFDLLLSQLMETGHSQQQAIQFADRFIRLYLVEEKHRSPVSEFDVAQTLEALSRVSQNRPNPEGLSSLLECVQHQSAPQGFVGSGRDSHYSGELDKAPGGSTSIPHTVLPHDFDDPPGLNEKVDYLLREWVRLYHHAGAGPYSSKAFQAFVPQLHQCGILKTDDLITRFFRLCTEMCVDLTYRALNDYAQNQNMARTKCFPTIDAYCRLIALLVKHSGDAANSITKINLLNRVLGIVETVLIQDHEMKQGEFHQLAYHRIIVMLLLELNAPEPVLEAINFQILSCFTTTLHNLNPLRAPGFAYAWLELVAHRTLCSKLLLNSPQQKGWVLYHQLLIELFKFLAPFLRNVELARQTHLLYKGTLRVLLVLLHDFPEFLCDYHFSFCDVIPPNCIQMRNLILSAFPRNMRLPDPFTPNLKVDLLTDIAHAPRILTNFAAAIQPASFKKDLDSYLKTRAPVTFLSELRSHLQVSYDPSSRGYNVPLMNALVLYVGTQAIAYIQSKSGTPSISTITHSSHMDIFQNLAVDLDTEGRYLFLNAIANQLRYPNSHTHYFSCTLLYLFAEANSEAIQEQITRVLLERLIVNRPHPWGLLITFIELIKNHNYKFWNHDFVHCAPEIEKLFESVARSCMQQKHPTGRNGSEPQE